MYEQDIVAFGGGRQEFCLGKDSYKVEGKVALALEDRKGSKQGRVFL